MGVEDGGREAATTIENVAIIFGVTGLVGKELARRLISTQKWKVYGVARRNPDKIFSSIKSCTNDFNFISCDLLDPVETQQKLALLEDVTHVFWVTWASKYVFDMRKCCEQNKAMMSNALNAILPTAKALKHVSLQTGMKHYVSLQGPFDENKVRFYDEDCPRVSSSINFYYVLEDLLQERLSSKVAWSVHRPGLLIGSSRKTLYNFMGSLCVYAAICKRENLPFVFGGTRECWEDLCIDGSDVRLVAEQQIWAATNDDIQSSDGQPFNAINGSNFTWKEIWPSIGNKFGLELHSKKNKMYFSQDFRYAKAMSDKKQVWRDIVLKEGLVSTEMEDLANWEFLDVLFRCPVKMLGSREKADQFGFEMRYNTLDSILYWIDFMKDEKLIP
ncbi:hypothetical protein Dsin_020567 [Dipteronia sinensis]|uniref:PRISE-like Rossmann-fold domain-containing protein n=1 Tax=Dipteronia sinensis TaxID=43782 RepID=A0AAE0AAT3_9ROSI|nr:hypothetical protein Dsin_020567 [Dipteronia sinensis]